jgi:hypothetical protein
VNAGRLQPRRGACRHGGYLRARPCRGPSQVVGLPDVGARRIAGGRVGQTTVDGGRRHDACRGGHPAGGRAHDADDRARRGPGRPRRGVVAVNRDPIDGAAAHHPLPPPRGFDVDRPPVSLPATAALLACLTSALVPGTRVALREHGAEIVVTDAMAPWGRVAALAEGLPFVTLSSTFASTSPARRLAWRSTSFASPARRCAP